MKWSSDGNSTLSVPVVNINRLLKTICVVYAKTGFHLDTLTAGKYIPVELGCENGSFNCNFNF